MNSILREFVLVESRLFMDLEISESKIDNKWKDGG